MKLEEGIVQEVSNFLNLPIDSFPISNHTASKNFDKILDGSSLEIIDKERKDHKNSPLRREYFTAYRYLIISEIFWHSFLKKAALYSARRAIQKGLKYNFLNIVFLASRVVSNVEAKQNNLKSYNKSTAQFKKYLNYYKIEQSIEIERNNIFSLLSKERSINTDVATKLLDIINKYEKHERNIPSFYFHVHFYSIKHLYFSHKNNHVQIYENSCNALAYFNSLKFSYIPGKLIFTFTLITFNLQRKKFDECQKLIYSALTLVVSRKSHWFKIKENEILLNLFSKNYNNAIQLYLECRRLKAFNFLKQSDSERWKLMGAYINLIDESQNQESIIKRNRRYSVQRFINDQVRFTKDKRAMNIPILIVEMCFFIIRKQYNQAIDRIEALEKYTSRYLRNDETFRSNCFIKMLVEIPKQNFNKIRVDRHTSSLKSKLYAAQIELLNQPFEVEVVPYENLWEIIINSLESKKHFKSRISNTTR